jgi:hypothetical protein
MISSRSTFVNRLSIRRVASRKLRDDPLLVQIVEEVRKHLFGIDAGFSLRISCAALKSRAHIAK